MNVTFRQLRVFVAVAEQGSVMDAASALHLTASAVSMQLKELQKNTGLILFTRKNRRLVLSPGGVYFLAHARRLITDLKEAEDGITHFKGLGRGTLTIGIQRTSEYFVPRLLALFNENRPGIDLKMRVVNGRQQLLTLMESGEIDLSVMARPPNDNEALVQGFAPNPYVFVCPPRHPLFGKSKVPIRALDECRFIVREQGSGTRIAMQRFLANHQCRPQISMEIESNETIKQSIMAGMGCGFLSLHCIGLELRSGLLGLLGIIDTPVMGVWNLVSFRSRSLSPLAEAFRDFVMKQGAKDIKAHDATLLSGSAILRARTR